MVIQKSKNMKNKLYYFASLSVLAFWSCNSDQDIIVPKTTVIEDNGKPFIATTESYSPETKTSLNNGNVLWKTGDQVSVFAASTINDQYQVTDGSNGKTSASLNKINPAGFVAGVDLDDNVAYYPYSASNEVAKNGSDYDLTVSLPSIQSYAENSFANGAFPMVAVTDGSGDMNLTFKNVLGGLKLQLKGTATISRITVTGNNNEILYGDATVTASKSVVPSIVLSDASAKVITLDCGAGVALDAETATNFIIALPPMIMTGGFTVVVTDTEGKEMEIKSTRPQTITRSSLLKMPAVTYEGTYISTVFGDVFGMELLPDGVDEKRITNISFIVNSDQTTETTIPSSHNPIYFELDGTTAKYYTSGKYYELNDAYYLFKDWTSLLTIDFSNVHTEHCTRMLGMFAGCQSLQSITFGEFFSTENVTDMGEMFYDCNQLAALDLRSFDTRNVIDMHMMFVNCNSLETINLSSFNTENVRWMYMMFQFCAKLRELDLSGFNTFNVEQMQGMFEGCYSLEYLNLSSFCFDISPWCSNFLSRCQRLMYLDLGTNDMSNDNLDGFCQRFALSIPYCYIRCSETSKNALKQSSTQLDSDKVIWIGAYETMPTYTSYKDPGVYYSTDYSMDKAVTTVQQSITGKGADLIFIGDGYSDRLIEDGTYDSDLETAIEAIFSLEPMSSYRNLFNIYKVYAVSETEIIGNNTALQTAVGSDGYMMSDSYICNSYAALACPGSGIHGTGTSLNNATIIVVINSDNDHGISYTSVSRNPGDYISDYGQSCEAMAFIGKGTNEEVFNGTVLHEFGHAFAKLADEYYSTGEMGENAKNYMIESDSNTGNNKNVDYTNDPLSIKWHQFLNDNRYNGVVGIFEGGHANYDKGVWRPSENSIMKSMTGEFNAPSREAIYYRIHKLAYGEEWVYDYETFVQQDLKNIPQAAPLRAPAKRVSSPARVNRQHFFKMEESVTEDGKKIITIMQD